MSPANLTFFLRAGARVAAWAAMALLTVDATAQPAGGGLLRLRINADIRSTDPGVNRDANTDALTAHLVEGLVAFREDTSVGPLLAQSVAMSADGIAYTFTLRPGLKFSNGAPLSSDDVLFAWHRYMKPETGWRCLSEFDGRGQSKVAKVEAPDARTVVFTLERPSALFLVTLARPDCGGTGIYHRSSLAADGSWRAPVGTGPFRLGDWKRNQSIELLRNEHYAALPGNMDGNTGNKAPAVDRVLFMVIPDPSAAKAALISGGIDLITDVDDEDVSEYRRRSDIRLATAPSMDLNGVVMQTRDPLLKDARIRRAIALTLDIPQMVDAITDGVSPASRSAIPPASPWYGPAQKAMSGRDVPAARRLLAEAGYRGQPIHMLTTKRYPNLFTTAVLTQAMGAEAGLRIELEVLDWAALLEHYSRGSFQMMSYSYSSRLDPSLSYEMFTGDKTTEPRKMWEDPAARRLLQRSMNETDHAKRQALFDGLDAQLRQDVPVIWTYSKVRTSAARAWVVGFKGWPLGTPRAWGIRVLPH
jgi:peptide/nickel transport system substrate-binding protein